MYHLFRQSLAFPAGAPPARRSGELVYSRALDSLQGDVSGALAFAPDGKRLFFAGERNRLKALDLTDNTATRALTGQTYLLSALACNPKTGQLATGTWSKTINLWMNGQMTHTLSGHQGKISHLAFSPDGRWLISGSWDGTARLWDSLSGKALGILHTGGARILALAISPDQRLLAALSDAPAVYLWRLETNPALRSPSERLLPLRTLHLSGKAYTLAFGPGNRLAVGGEDGAIRLWRLDSPGLWRWYARLLPWGKGDIWRGHERKLLCLAFSPDSQWLASGGEESPLMLWNAATGWVREVLPGHEQAVAAAAFHPDGQHIATLDRRQTLRLWKIPGGRLARAVTASSPDGT